MTARGEVVAGVLRNKLFGGQWVNQIFETQSNAISTIQDLLKRTIVEGEGNSLLLTGPSGCGKSWVLKQALSNISTLPKCKGNFVLVRLNGLMHTDDRIALLDIARQLNMSEESIGDRITLSFSGALDFLLQALREGSGENQSVVFVLDNFDLFAHHKNQTLLYNLFDIAQSARNPIAVIGLTTRLDAIELLEKRVRSRFSHRHINLFTDFSFEKYLELFSGLLKLPLSHTDRKYREAWNKRVEALASDRIVRDCVKKLYKGPASIGALIDFLAIPVCQLGVKDEFLQVSDFQSAIQVLMQDSMAAILTGVSVLELCLIIAMKHLGDVSTAEHFNFEMVYNEYKKFTQRSRSVEFFGKPVALKAFEHLISLEVVSPADSSGVPSSSCHGNKAMKEYQSMVLMLTDDQFKEALQSYPNCPTDIQRWGQTAGIV